MTEENGITARIQAESRAGEVPTRGSVPRRDEDRLLVGPANDTLRRKLKVMLASANHLVPPNLPEYEQMQWIADTLLRNSPRNGVHIFMRPLFKNDVLWDQAKEISDIPAVHEALEAFSEDQTEDNAAGLILAIMQHVEAMHEKNEPTVVVREAERMMLVTDPRALQPGRNYWLKDKIPFGETFISMCKERDGKPYFENHIWGGTEKNQAMAKWHIAGPIPKSAEPDFDALLGSKA
jgi:hypothetical protein